MEKMLAAVFEGNGKLSLKERDIPEVIKRDDVLIEVEACGICGTDIQILRVPPGHPANEDTILGHEYVGRVIEKGKDVDSLEVGDRVAVDPNIKCGNCRYCRMGMTNMCEKMTTLGIFIDGGFAKYNISPEKALYKIPKSLDTTTAALIEPLSCVVSGFNKLNIQAGSSAVVFGSGPIGLLYTMLLKSAGVGKVIVAELSDFRIKYAKMCGADIVVNPREENLKEIVFAETEIGADFVIDAVGSLMDSAVDIVRAGGTVELFGMNKNATCGMAQYWITRKEIKVIGTYIANFNFLQTIDILRERIIDAKRIVTHEMKLEDIHKGFEVLERGKAIKVIIKP